MTQEQIISKLNNMQSSIGQTLMLNTIMFNPQMLYYQLRIVQQELYNIISDNEKEAADKNTSTEQNETNTKEPNEYELLLGAMYKKYMERNKFDNTSKIENSDDLVVMAIDIRKSTFYLENSLKPKYFVKLLEEINKSIICIVKKYYGLINKFTGDGFIVFFPKFYSGENYLLLSLLCSKKIIVTTKSIFESNEEYYHKFPVSPGIGIGMDIGKADLLKVNYEATYIGRCVVNACRICRYSINEILVNSLLKAEINRNEEIELDQCIGRGIPYKDNPEIKVYSITVNNVLKDEIKPKWSLTPAST